MPPKKDKGKEKKGTFRICLLNQLFCFPHSEGAADSGEVDAATIAKAFELQIEVLQRQLGKYLHAASACSRTWTTYRHE
jgi:hypothetical protein